MGWTSLGKVAVTSAGTPVSAVTNVSASGAFGTNQTYYACQAVLFQVWPSNTGKIYIGDRATFSKSTGVGLLAVLVAPTATSNPSAGASLPNAPAALNASQYYIDADNSNDAVIVSILVG